MERRKSEQTSFRCGSLSPLPGTGPPGTGGSVNPELNALQGSELCVGVGGSGGGGGGGEEHRLQDHLEGRADTSCLSAQPGGGGQVSPLRPASPPGCLSLEGCGGHRVTEAPGKPCSPGGAIPGQHPCAECGFVVRAHIGWEVGEDDL